MCLTIMGHLDAQGILNVKMQGWHIYRSNGQVPAPCFFHVCLELSLPRWDEFWDQRCRGKGTLLLRSLTLLPPIAYKRWQLFFFSFEALSAMHTLNSKIIFAHAATMIIKSSQQAQCNTDYFSEGSKNETCPYPVRRDSLVRQMIQLKTQKWWVLSKEYYLQQGLLFLKMYSWTLVS